MVLPQHLANRFYEKLSFYSNTVSTFEQYTLAAFIHQGYFEKHINRMRLHYVKKRAKILEIIRSYFDESECQILENESGLHFLLQFNTALADKEVEASFQKKQIRMVALTDYYIDDSVRNMHQFLLNYSNMEMDGLEEAVIAVKQILQEKK